MDIETKVCNNCHKEKLLSEFFDNKIKHCKICTDKVENRKEYLEKYKKENIEKIRAYDRKWKKEHRNIKYQKKYYLENIDRIKQRDRKKYIREQKIHLFRSAKKRAIKYNLHFDIDLRYIESIWPVNNICPIRKTELTVGTNKNHDNSPSIDRIIPNLGYVKNNIMIISYIANKVKADASVEDLKKIRKNITNYKKPQKHDIDKITMALITKYRIKCCLNKTKSNQFRIMDLESSLLKSAERRANKKNIEFNLTKDYIKSIWPIDNKCPFTNRLFTVGEKGYRDSASIDRIDPSVGYIEGNVQIVSTKFNSIKNSLAIDELKKILDELINYL